MTRAEAWSKAVAAATNGDVETTLKCIADWLKVDRENESHELVKSCLESAEDHCRSAAMDYYASTK
jgi:hypothetical protein